MMRVFAVVLLMLGLSGPVFAQSRVGPITVTAAVNIPITLVGTGNAAVTVQANGGGSYTATFQVSDDNINWVAETGTPQAGGSPTSTATGDGFWVFSVGGYGYFRVEITAVTTAEAFTVVAGQ